MMESEISAIKRVEGQRLIDRNGGFVADSKKGFAIGKKLLIEKSQSQSIPIAELVIRGGLELSDVVQALKDQGINDPWGDVRFNVSIYIDSSAAGNEAGLAAIAAAFRAHGEARKGAMVVFSEKRTPQAMFEVMVNMQTFAL